MSLQFWAVNNDGDLVEWTDRLPADTLEVTIHAEECSVGNSQITIRDTDAGFNVRGHRLAYFIETDAIDDDWYGIIGPFFVNTRKVTRDLERMGAARTWTISLDDVNTLLARRVQKGADAERDEETDIARLTWLLSTNEATGGYDIEDTAFIFTDAPVTMSESNYRGVESAQVVNDLFQQSGNNAYLFNSPTAPGEIRVGMWYGRDEREDFASPHRISNDLAEISPETMDAAWLFDPTFDYTDQFTFAPSLDAELDRDPSRVYSGAYVNWDGGWSYVQRQGTVTDYAARDGVFSAELVKNQTRGDARATRYTRDLRNEDDAITCAVIVPNALVHAWVPGHRVSVKFTHLPAYEDWTWMRVAAVTVRQLSFGSGLYELALDLRGEEPPEVGQPGGPSVPGDTFATLNRPGTVSSTGSGGLLMWGSSGDDNKPGWPYEPTQGLLSIIEDLTPPRPGWPFEGILVEGDGTLDRIEFMADAVGIPHLGTCTVVWAININGIAVAEGTEIATAGAYFWHITKGIVAENVTVSTGDVITATVTSTPNMPYFRVPGGTGVMDERLRIIGGTLT
jgi:hypothetical protein